MIMIQMKRYRTVHKYQVLVSCIIVIIGSLVPTVFILVEFCLFQEFWSDLESEVG